MKSPPRILAHNLLRSVCGQLPDGSPLIQPAILHAGECYDDCLSFLRCFITTHTASNPPHTAALEWYVTHFKAEFATIFAVCRHVAYFPQKFNPQIFADSLTETNLWLGQSFYRIANLIRAGHANYSPVWIDSAIRVIAAIEAGEVYSALISTTNPNLILVDADIFEREAGDEGHETV